MRLFWQRLKNESGGVVREIKAPSFIQNDRSLKVFLAGTIDIGNSEDWQKQVAESFSKKQIAVTLLNPRRDDWNNDLKQTIDEPQFYQQVNWELNALDKADHIIMNFLPDSKSPITLLELGLYADSGKLIVICPDEFYRSGNVHIVCDRYDIPLYKSLKEIEL